MVTRTETFSGTRKDFHIFVATFEEVGWAVRTLISDEIGIIIVFERELERERP